MANPVTYSKLSVLKASQMLIVNISIEYADALLLKTIELCIHEDDKPNLPTSPLPLSQYEHPDKDTIPLFSRYS